MEGRSAYGISAGSKQKSILPAGCPQHLNVELEEQEASGRGRGRGRSVGRTVGWANERSMVPVGLVYYANESTLTGKREQNRPVGCSSKDAGMY